MLPLWRPFRAWIFGGDRVPRALPWADIERPFGAEYLGPSLLHRSPFLPPAGRGGRRAVMPNGRTSASLVGAAGERSGRPPRTVGRIALQHLSRSQSTVGRSRSISPARRHRCIPGKNAIVRASQDTGSAKAPPSAPAHPPAIGLQTPTGPTPAAIAPTTGTAIRSSTPKPSTAPRPRVGRSRTLRKSTSRFSDRTRRP